jgi:hypothetical protein
MQMAGQLFGLTRATTIQFGGRLGGGGGFAVVLNVDYIFVVSGLTVDGQAGGLVGVFA